MFRPSCLILESEFLCKRIMLSKNPILCYQKPELNKFASLCLGSNQSPDFQHHMHSTYPFNCFKCAPHKNGVRINFKHLKRHQFFNKIDFPFHLCFVIMISIEIPAKTRSAGFCCLYISSAIVSFNVNPPWNSNNQYCRSAHIVQTKLFINWISR